ncbi:MAG: hypothetical protein AB7K09_22165 [Planctomycetota bacterium]
MMQSWRPPIVSAPPLFVGMALAALVLLAGGACAKPVADNGNNNNGNGNNNAGNVFNENFTAANGSNWPGEWMPISTSRVNADIQDNRGRLQCDAPPIVARVVSTTLAMMNFEATFTIRFGDFANQGIGFYGRQNGGHLMTTVPNGQGFAIFTEGSGVSDFGLWEETSGTENEVFGVAGPLVAGGILNDTDYRVRYRVQQVSGTQTLLQARIWPAADSEPGTWTVEYTSSTSVLQNLTGGFAVDLYNYSGSGSITIDDIQITDLGS